MFRSGIKVSIDISSRDPDLDFQPDLHRSKSPEVIDATGGDEVEVRHLRQVQRVARKEGFVCNLKVLNYGIRKII